MKIECINKFLSEKEENRIRDNPMIIVKVFSIARNSESIREFYIISNM